MNKINYIKGDAVEPQGEGLKIICHISNDSGGWGAGFVLALSRKWKQPEATYRSVNHKDLLLGNIQLIQVEEDIYVANMIAQAGIGFDNNGKPPIRYNALRTALEAVNKVAIEMGATLHAPKFGAGLSGGKWDIIENIIEEVVTVPITIYNFK